MERTLKVDDTLQDCVDGAIEEVKDVLENFLKENPDTSETPDMGNDLDYSGRIHEIVDGSVPVYYHEIDTAWYLHGDALEEAYENAGIGDNPRENSGMVAVYCYIEQAVQEWYQDNAEDIFDEWREKQDAKAEEEED